MKIKSGRVSNLFAFPAKVLRPVKNYLVSQQRRLEVRKKRLVAEDPFSDSSRLNDNAASDADAAEISGHDRVEALKIEVERRLITIRKALTKIKLGRYGLCENCGKMIDTDRLRIDPTADLCINCAKKRSKRKRIENSL